MPWSKLLLIIALLPQIAFASGYTLSKARMAVDGGTNTVSAISTNEADIVAEDDTLAVTAGAVKRAIDTEIGAIVETDPLWTSQSNSFARRSGFSMEGNINLNAYTLDNGVVDASQLTLGTVPAAAYGATAGTTNAITSTGLIDISGMLGLVWVTNSVSGTNTISVDLGTNTFHLSLEAGGGFSSGATELSGLSDVADLSGAFVGESLNYNGSIWTNSAGSWLAPDSTLASVTNLSITRDDGVYVVVDLATNTVLSFDGTFPTTGRGLVSLDVRMNSFSLSEDTNTINAADWVALDLSLTNTYQSIIFRKPYGETVWRAN